MVCSLALSALGNSVPHAAAAGTTRSPGNDQSSSLPPDPLKNPASPVMLRGPWVPANPQDIDFNRLPRVPAQHIVVSDVSAANGVNQHNYLIYFDGRFWAMWSDGPGIEDRAGQVVKYATSRDGLTWGQPRFVTPYPPNSGRESPYYNTRTAKGFRYISRGFWVREGRLIALASIDEAGPLFGPSLQLRGFQWDGDTGGWRDIGVVCRDTINNFPPERLPNGQWGMMRRAHDYTATGVQFLFGGVKAIDQWTSVPVVAAASRANPFKAEEPIWWTLPDGNLLALFRDNAGSHYLFRSFSTDDGRTWTPPVRTDFPDARSKLHGIRLQDGRYVLVSNANPKGRDPLTLALSNDGIVFDRMFYLVGGRPVDYPQVMEHNGYLYIAHSGAKRSVEIERVRLADLDAMVMPASVR